MSTLPLISCRGLTKIYPLSGVEVLALRGVDLDIERGEMVAIMGPSGSGKSTLMNILGCMDQQSGGSFFFDGVDISELDARELAALRNKKLGFVFQRYNLLPRASALYNVEIPLFYSGMYGDEVKSRALAALSRFGIDDLADHRPNQLSGGQQQRVAIARAVVNNPLVVLADEPTGALDTTNSLEVMKILQKMHIEQGVTIIIITHEPEIAGFCPRKLIMRDGKVISDELSAKDVRSKEV